MIVEASLSSTGGETESARVSALTLYWLHPLIDERRALRAGVYNLARHGGGGARLTARPRCISYVKREERNDKIQRKKRKVKLSCRAKANFKRSRGFGSDDIILGGVKT